MIMKYLLLILLTFFSIKTDAQNVFFGDTLRFDISAVCKLLYSKNVIQEGVNESYFKDTLILSENDKKSIETFFDKKK